MMSLLWASVKQVCRLPLRHIQPGNQRLLLDNVMKLTGGTQISTPCGNNLSLKERAYSTYNPNPDFDPTPSPFKKRQAYRYGYKYKFFKGGLLPRPEGELEDKPVKGLPQYDPRKYDNWTEKKALFGQNDYIDILGDGSIHPVQLVTGPFWLRGFRGNEMQRLIRLLKFKGKFLKEVYPKKYLDIQKRIFYLHKQFNTKRRHAPYWGSSRRRNRIHDINNTLR